MRLTGKVTQRLSILHVCPNTNLPI